MSNTTHRKRLARLYAAATGTHTHAQALDVVKAALAAGQLPARLDPSGMDAALRILLGADAPTDRGLWIMPEGRFGNGKDPGTIRPWMIDLDAPAAGDPSAPDTARVLDVLGHQDHTPRSLGDRSPYVGACADGARRSAEIDRSEADGLDYDDPRRGEVLASAEAWEAQAERMAAAATPRRCECVCHDPADGRQPAHGAGPCICVAFPGRFTDPDFLGACAPGDPTSLLAVASNLVSAPRVVTFWYPTAWNGQGDGRVHRLVRSPLPALTGDRDLVLVDAEGEEAEESFDWSEDPEKAARHRVHPDGLGVTFFTPIGEPSCTHRAEFTDESLTVTPSVGARA